MRHRVDRERAELEVLEQTQLGQLDEAALAAAELCVHRRALQRGQVLFNEGDIGSSMYVLLSGRIELQVSSAAGHVLTLHVVQPGEIFGEVALVVDEHRRTSRGKALENSVVGVLARSDFERLRIAYACFDRLLVSVLARRVQRTTVQALELKLPPETRVWRRMAALALAYGDQPIGLTQSALAELAGTVRQTANRVIREGAEAGVLVTGRGSLQIIDPKRLAELAESAG